MKYGVNELRRMYLDFFESKGHLKMKSFSLVPHNDDSLLLINAGMAPLKPYFTGQEIPPRRRVTTCQKCVRTGDIENVGKTARHLTFFEMLGNFSFGDYFKREAINWSWEFLTQVLKLDPDRLYVTIFENDDEAFTIWNKEVGVDSEKIYRIGRDATIIFPLIFTSMDRIDVISNAMELRCFGKNKKRTWYMGRPLKAADYIVIASTVILSVVALLITFSNGSRFYNPFI